MHFKSTRFFGTLTVTNAGVGTSYYPTFHQLTDYTSYQALFDSYRINKMAIKFIPRRTMNILGTGSFNKPTVVTALDYDGGLDPASLDEMLDFNSHKIHDGLQPWTRIFTPAIKVTAEQGTTQKFKQWIDLANVDVPHYGLKLYADPHGTTTAYEVDIFYTTYFSLKQRR